MFFYLRSLCCESCACGLSGKAKLRRKGSVCQRKAKQKACKAKPRSEARSQNEWNNDDSEARSGSDRKWWNSSPKPTTIFFFVVYCGQFQWASWNGPPYTIYYYSVLFDLFLPNGNKSIRNWKQPVPSSGDGNSSTASQSTPSSLCHAWICACYGSEFRTTW